VETTWRCLTNKHPNRGLERPPFQPGRAIPPITAILALEEDSDAGYPLGGGQKAVVVLALGRRRMWPEG